MQQERNYNYVKLFLLLVAIPFLYGCGPGTGVGALSGFLFGGGVGSSIPEIALLSTGFVGGDGGAGLATLHQPEPASMLLMGSGLIAMGYFKSKTNQRRK